MAKAIRRLGIERLEVALDCLKDCRRAEAIHCARKDIKRVRAVLRMGRTHIAEKELRRFSELLRETASHLAAPRDAYVKVKTLKALAAHFKGQLAPRSLRHIRSRLRYDFDEEMRRFAGQKKAKAVERVLIRLTKEFEGLEVDGKGWKAIGPGVKAAYGKGRIAWQRAQIELAPEDFHRWRKRAKDLWYQVTLLRPVWPEQMDAMAHELETLSEYLGDDHDLFVLQQFLPLKCESDAERRELEVLHGLIEERQRELRAAALTLGQRFYAEKSSTFCHRLAGYWHVWRQEDNRCIQSTAAS